MKNALQDQLFKSGLIKKQDLAQTLRDKAKQRSGKQPQGKDVSGDAENSVDAARLMAERAERDRALSAEQNLRAKQKELQAQVRQLIAQHRVEHAGDLPYRFQHDGRIATILVTRRIRDELASGRLAIVADGDTYAVLPRAPLATIKERGGSVLVDHSNSANAAPAANSDDDAFYARFEVPDDLVW